MEAGIQLGVNAQAALGRLNRLSFRPYRAYQVKARRVGHIVKRRVAQYHYLGVRQYAAQTLCLAQAGHGQHVRARLNQLARDYLRAQAVCVGLYHRRQRAFIADYLAALAHVAVERVQIDLQPCAAFIL